MTHSNVTTQLLKLDGQCLKFPSASLALWNASLALSPQNSDLLAPVPGSVLGPLHWRDQVPGNATGVVPRVPFHPRSREPITNGVPSE